ncbi:IS66 family transposase [Oceanobacillus oncorhynchi]|uniref:IS66 family transposase n=1 Tax=Oceanobacillus oncorhynchi TaxID=545501 RepID=UPI0034D5E28C
MRGYGYFEQRKPQSIPLFFIILLRYDGLKYRKFLETNDLNGQGAVGVHYCDQLFKLEKQWKDLSPDERLQQSQLESKPLLKEFWEWLEGYLS